MVIISNILQLIRNILITCIKSRVVISNDKYLVRFINILTVKLADMETILQIPPDDITFCTERVAQLYSKQVANICSASDFHHCLQTQKYNTGNFGFGTEDLLLHWTKISHPTFIPGIEHMLSSRIKTTGIVDTKYVLSGCKFQIYDGTHYFLYCNTQWVEQEQKEKSGSMCLKIPQH